MEMRRNMRAKKKIEVKSHFPNIIMDIVKKLYGNK